MVTNLTLSKKQLNAECKKSNDSIRSQKQTSTKYTTPGLEMMKQDIYELNELLNSLKLTYQSLM